MSLAIGATFGPYEITAPLGAGGMGEVYRARDPRLHRDVAIKVLPDLFAADRERLSRFEREAQALAALNHANIAQIHGIEEAPGAPGRPPVRGLVMEFVDGEDLTARLARGPLPLDEALAIARQVADALEAAHEQGIVHRDLKPANIKVRADGTVKVLDFGLAKAMVSADALPAAAALEHSPTFTSPALMTHAGVILGTAAYMAPEQARGKPVDRRADVWAFGAVLYEMLTGRRPFEGDTSTDVLGAIVHKEPDWTLLPATTPVAVRRLLRRCLEKERRQRLRDIGDARLELDTTRDAPEAAAGAPVRGTRPVFTILAVAAVAALAGVAAGRFSAPAAPPAPGPQRFEIRLPDATSGVVSPDGSRVVFVSGGRLLVRDLDRVETRELAGTDGALKPFWSPDSATIGYGAAGKLYRVAATGGAPSLICSLPNNEWDQDAGAAWRPDDTIVLTTGSSGLLRVAAVGGDPVSELAPDAAKELHFHDAAPLPGGRGVLFVVHRIGEAGGNPVDTIELQTATGRKVLLRAEGQSLANPVYSPSGHVLFNRVPTNAGMWAVPFSLDRLEATGEPFLLIAGARGHSVGSDGTMVYFPPVPREPVRLTWLDRRGEVVDRIGEAGDLRGIPALSPDGSRVAVLERTDAGVDLWLHHLGRGTRTRLTTDGSVIMQAWMPDGRSLLYTSAVNAIRTIRRVAADGSGRTDDVSPGWGATASADGKALFYRGGDKPDVMVRQMSGDARPTLLLKADEAVGLVAPSPDGRWIAHAAYQGAAPQMFVRPFPGGQGRWQVSRSGGLHPRWSADSRRLFFAQDNDIFEVSVEREPELAFGEPRRLFTRRPLRGLTGAAPFDVSPDGQRFLVLQGEGEVVRDTSVVVVLNWSPDSEMRR